MPDLEKVIKGLETCYGRPLKCENCTYRDVERNCQDVLCLDALALLKEQKKQKFFVDSDGKITPLPDVVRCKDCAYRGNEKKCIVAFVADKQDFPFFFYDNNGTWYCADGKRADS